MKKLVPIIDIPYDKIAPRVIVCGDPKRAENAVPPQVPVVENDGFLYVVFGACQ